MFYSQTFLAKKGPLGTVWCAAHLQHRLKKSHYASTHIPKTVDQIMTPDVPLALRMSAHLLLGVVRIYSKKLDYLHRDYIQLRDSLWNTFRAAAHLNTNLNLPEISTQAAFKALTLPQKFDLDAFDPHLFSDNGSPDTHLLSEDEITLKDQYHANHDLYVKITFDNDINPEGSLHMDTEMLIDSSPRVPDSSIPADPSHMDTETTIHIASLKVPDPTQAPEVMRDRDDTIFLSPVLRPHVESATFEPNRSPSGDTTMRDIDTPKSLHTSIPQMQPRTSPHGSGPSSPLIDRTQFETGSFEAPKTTELELRPSPSPSPQRPQPRQRRRKRAFDEALVLNNTFYKKALNDASDLVKKRKKLPSSSLEMWRFMNSKNKEQLFLNPLISGMCTSLQHLSSIELTVLSSKPPESPGRGPQFNDETEHLRSPDREPGHNVFSPSQGSIFRDAATSTSAGIPSMVTDPCNTVEYSFTGNTDVDMDTPFMNGGTNDDQTTTLPDIPEWVNSMESDDLLFLEQDNNSPPDSLSGSGRDTMSVRTRAVAQYLKNHSPLSNLTDGSPHDLSLNAILEGRSRKLSARMFYEALVLKDCGLIDLKQEEPYGDITLKLTPGISMEKL